jgi:formamidopyrimidine-DNA glycosylase
MPELPEVETVRRGLSRLIVSRKITSVNYDNPKSFPNSDSDVNTFLVGAEVTGVRRRAKVLMIDLSTKYSLVIHLKMTGQLVFVGRERFGAGHPNDSLIGELPDKSTRVTINFSDKTQLYFNDQRKFGWMKLLPTNLIVELPFMQKVGPEPLEDDFTLEVFSERLKRRQNAVVKAAILDQAVLAGVGNIYADESLWGAYIHPSRRVVSLTETEIANLYEQIRFVMNLSIEKGGSSNQTYVNAEGKKGSYMDFANVFRRNGKECTRHPGVLIEKIRVAGRGTHICPVCQVLD